MRILRIRLQNLNSLRSSVELDFGAAPFTHSGLFAITGDTGAGKTTLLDAMTLALFGKTSRKHEGEVMSYGATEAWAEVEFAATEGVFRAKWQQIRDKKGELRAPYREIARLNERGVFEKLETGKNKLDGTKDEKGLIERLCGLNFEQFRRSVMLAQGDFAAFLKADEKERSALLERLTDTEIYTRLSRAAFERAKMESARLGEFQRERELLRVLDADEIEALKSERRDCETQAQQHSAALEMLRANATWLETLEKIEQKRAQLAQSIAALEAERTSFHPALLRLERHRQTAPFSTQVARLQDFESEKLRLETDLQTLDAQLADLTEAARSLDIAFAEKKTQLAAAETERAALESVLENVLALDAQIAGQKAQAEKWQAEIGILQAKAEATAREKQRMETETADSQQELAQAEMWLADNPQAAYLPVDLSSARIHIGLLRENFKAQKMVGEKLAELRDKHATLEHERLELAESLAQAKAQLLENQTFLREIFRRNALPETDDLAAETELFQRTESTAAQLQSLEDFARHTAQYRQTIRDLGAVREEQANLLIEDFAVGKDLLSALDLLDELEEKSALKWRRVEREMLIINYERDRQNLQTGEACPLCGSTEHPFRLHETQIFVDDARAEFEAVQSQLEATRHHQQSLATRHLQLRDRIGAVQEDFDDVLNAQLLHMLERIAEQERAIGRILPAFFSKNVAEIAGESPMRSLEEFEAREELLFEKIESLRVENARLRADRDQANARSRQIRELEKQRFEAETALRNQTSLIDLKVAEMLTEEKNLAALQIQFAGEQQALNSILKKHALAFSPTNDFREQFAKLESQEKTFAEKTEHRAKLAAQLEGLRQEMARLSGILSGQTAELSQKQTDFDHLNHALASARNERFALFGDKDPKQERAIFAEKIETLRRDIEAVQGQKHELDKRQAAFRESQNSKQKSQADLAKKSAEVRADIEKSLKKSGFADVESLLAAVLPAPEAENIENQQQELLRREAELAQSQRDTESAWQTESARSFEFRDAEALKSRLTEASNAYQIVLQRIGGIESQLAANAERAREARELLQKINAQKREVERWSKLKDLIGSADGSVFRRFAQSLTLQQLVHHANAHLGKLNGRFRIRRRADKDLELDIVDTFQADNTRSMNTLSGGETFLVSLALALGLADLAGRKTRVQSLFIDEGFGALDESALELAITTLENLQARGTTIGIISHIRELKERIGVQVSVTKRGDGFSEVTVLG